MPEVKQSPRRDVLRTGLALAFGCLATQAAHAKPTDDDYNQPKLDRTLVKYQDHPGPDGHQCGLCTNFITPNACRVVDGTIVPTGYCLSFAPKDIDP